MVQRRAPAPCTPTPSGCGVTARVCTRASGGYSAWSTSLRVSRRFGLCRFPFSSQSVRLANFIKGTEGKDGEATEK